MLRKDSSFREIAITDSLEQRSFLNLARKPSTTKMLDSNKENTARTYSDTSKEFFFKKDLEKVLKKEQPVVFAQEQRYQKSYLESRLDQLEHRKKTPTPSNLITLTPLQAKQASQERYSSNNTQRKQSVNSSVNMKIQAINSPAASQEFNIYKQPAQQTSIPNSYLDASITQRTQPKSQASPEKPKVGPTLKQYYVTSMVKAFRQKGPNAAKEHLIQNMQGVIIAKKLKVPPSNPKKHVTLPSTDKKTIIFDLDETLVHCNSSSFTPGDVLLNITFENGENMDASINIRPYTQHLLQSLSRHFELIIFTASQSSYANAVIDYLDPTRRLIQHRFYREHCIPIEGGHFIKDLRIFNRKIEDILIVDNAPHSYLYQLNNGVPIIPYIDNKQDEELKALLTYLMQFKNVKDVRDLNSQLLKLNRFSEYDDPNELLRAEFYEYY